MTPKSDRPQTSIVDPASFILVEWILGTLSGVIVASWLDVSIENRRVLAMIAAFAAVGGAMVFRSLLGRIYAPLSLHPFAKRITPYVWMSIGLSTIVGGLAGHDLCELFQDTSGAIIGLASGTLAAVSKAILTVLYFHEHPHAGIDFE